MLTDEGDMVVDPFAGSCVSGEVSERLKRQWRCIELREDYVEAARGRFSADRSEKVPRRPKSQEMYRVPRPSLLWDSLSTQTLADDGGQKKPKLKTQANEEEGCDRGAA